MALGRPREHGGGLDAAVARYGGQRRDWLDLSTGINPVPYPVGQIDPGSWTSLPDVAALQALEAAARSFWSVPAGAAVLAAPGASSLIARLPTLLEPSRVRIAERTYNEHEAAFRGAGWDVARTEDARARVVVHPNNPTGLLWSGDGAFDHDLLVIDESFCDIALGASHMSALATEPGVVILKSLGKFWGLAGLRLGFAIGDPELIAALSEALGPWPVSGPALSVGRRALEDGVWANRTRQRLHVDMARLDALMQARGAEAVGGTALFRLFEVGDGAAWQRRLAKRRVWSRIFDYESGWLRLGLPHPDRWDQLEDALS